MTLAARLTISVLLAWCCMAASWVSLTAGPVAGTLTTVVGTGPLHLYEGEPAIQTPLEAMMVAASGDGSLYVSDGSHIGLIGTDGAFHTVAGRTLDDMALWQTDGGDPLHEADSPLSRPVQVSAIAVGRASELYFATREATWHLGDDGKVTSVGPPGFGLSVGPTGAIFIQTSDGTLLRVVPASPPQVLAHLGQVSPMGAGLAAASDGNVFVSDTRGNRVVRIGIDGSAVPLAGTGVRGFSGDDGPALSARLDAPGALALAPDGSLYVADQQSTHVRVVHPDGTISALHVAGGTAGQLVGFIHALAVAPDGTLYASDASQGLLARVTPDGTATPVLGPTSAQTIVEGGLAIQEPIGIPTGIAAGPDDSVFVGDLTNHRVYRVMPDGTLRTFAGGGGAPTNSPQALQLGQVGDVAASPDGTVYIVDTTSGLWVVAPDGAVSRARPAQGVTNIGYTSAAVGTDGALYVAGFSAALAGVPSFWIGRFRPNAILDIIAGSITATQSPGYNGDEQPATEALLNGPTRLAVGADGTVYFTDNLNQRVRAVTPDGVIHTVAGTGQPGYSGDGGPAAQAALHDPLGLAVAPDGMLFIADSSNHRVRRVTTDGMIDTVAGTGEPGNAGDRGPGTDAQLNGPTHLALDNSGNLFISDSGNLTVRKLWGAAQPD